MEHIRSQAAQSDSLIEVLPLADPAVADLSAQARSAEAVRAWDQVDSYLAAALDISPRDPELWQWRAEVALARQSWAEAEHHARRSARLGPRLGALCVRNWLTLMAAASESGDASAAEQARERAARCPVPKPVRL
ncbi:MAG: tetratricopeptide repeat protein [Lysobacterales bacterium]